MIDFLPYITERTRDFTGREWVFEKVSEWLADPDGARIFLLTGGPGSGKSAVAARLAQMSLSQTEAAHYPRLSKDSLAYFHFCQAQSDATLNPLRFVEALSAVLANRFPPFAAALLQVPHRDITITQNVGSAESGSQVIGMAIQSLNIGNLSARAALDWVVRRPLENLCKPDIDRAILILVDSLDEARTYGPDENIVMLLADTTRNAQDLPQQVRFLLTSRPDPRVLELIGKPSLDLVADAPPDAHEVRLYASHRLAKVPLDAGLCDLLTNRVAESSHDNFLYACYVLDDWLARPAEITADSALDLPADLSGIYRQFLKRELARDNEKWEDRYQPLLGLLAVARGEGLTVQHLTGASGLQRRQVDNALRACRQYLISPQPKGPLRLYHQSFRDFMVIDETYRVYPGEAHATLATYLLDEFGAGWLDCADNYALQHISTHLIEALRGAEHTRVRRDIAAALETLLTDLSFIEARTGSVGTDDLIAHLRAALDLLSPGDQAAEGEKSGEVQSILGLLEQEAVNLRGWHPPLHPTFFAQQVFNRARRMGLSAVVASAQTRLRQIGKAYFDLQWLGEAPLDNAGVRHRTRIIPVRAIAFTPFGLWTIKVSESAVLDGSSAREDDTLKAALHLTGHMLVENQPKALQLSLTVANPARKWAISVSDSVSESVTPRGDALQLTQKLKEVPTSSQYVGVDIYGLIISDEMVFMRDWMRFVSETRLAVTFNGEWLVSSMRDGSLLVWSLRVGGDPRRLKGHSGPVTALTVTSDGKRVVSASMDGTIRVWNLSTCELQMTTDPGRGVLALAIMLDDRHLVSASADGSLKLLNIKTGQVERTYTDPKGIATEVAVANDGSRVVYASRDHDLQIWNLAEWRPEHSLHGHKDHISALALVSGSRRAVSGSADRTLRVWDLESGQCLHTLTGHDRTIRSVLVTPDGKRVVSVSVEGVAKVWDLETGHEDQSLPSISGMPAAGVLSRDGRYMFATCWWQQSLSVWDIEALKARTRSTGVQGLAPEEFTKIGLDGELRHLGLGPDAGTVLTTDGEGRIYFLRLITPTL